MTAARAVAETIAWLADGARSAPAPPQVLDQLCARLVEAGIPLWRVGVFVRTLHPEVMGRRLLWQDGAGVDVTNAPFEMLDTPTFTASTVAHVTETRVALRRRLRDEGGTDGFPVLVELAAEGVTDYLALPLFFLNGEVHVVTCTTLAPDGFSDAAIAVLEAIATPLARVAEIHALRRTASNLLDTYVGHRTGERILAGRIRRGHVEAIDAAIWLSDMRGFTALADSVGPLDLIDLLIRYFDAQVPAIARQGGEVLKFMGDGLLAIFPVESAAGAEEVCRAALAAAREAAAGIAALRHPIVGGLRFGLALHLGEVLYGNIGGGNRLDFTCIGPAINLAARLEKLTAATDRAILASAEFARHCPEEVQLLGEFVLTGFAVPQIVYGLAENGK